MNLRRKAERFLRRLFHRKQRQSMSRRQRIGLECFHHALHRDMALKEPGLIVDGQFYEVAVGKFREIMKEEPKIKREGMFENSGLPVIETVTYTSIPVVRVSKLPEFLLSLGIRIHG